MTLIYKILGIIINSVAILLSISLVLSIPAIITSPLTLLSGFMMASIILYAWFSHQFHKKVLQEQQVVKKSLKDWVKVNGIVAIIFSLVIIVDVVLLIGSPQVFLDAIKKFEVNNLSVEAISRFLYIMLAYGIILLVHVIWTFILLRRNASYFQL